MAALLLPPPLDNIPLLLYWVEFCDSGDPDDARIAVSQLHEVGCGGVASEYAGTSSEWFGGRDEEGWR